MIFNSYSFILIFLPLCVGGFYLLKRAGNPILLKLYLLAASFFFYGWHNYTALAILIASIVCNYLFSSGIRFFCLRSKPRSAGLLLTAGVGLDLALLAYCKYLLFFEEISNALFSTHFVPTKLLLPLGISFYTFSEIAYLVDTARKPEQVHSLLDYALFVSFFPKVTVGPIALSSEMIPFMNDRLLVPADYRALSGGMIGLSFGLAKKVLLADTLGKIADYGFSNVTGLGSFGALLSMLSYTLQIYFDFSGYCDMARGVCKLLGLDLPVNFDSPYRALSVAEFWKKWHITLTGFFRNYVYIPLGGNRRGRFRTALHTIFVFLLSGLWHGASLNFILWGALHGVGMLLDKRLSALAARLPNFLRWFATFLFLNLTWVWFRTPAPTQALLFYRELFLGGWKMLPDAFFLSVLPSETGFLQWALTKFTNLTLPIFGTAVLLPLLFFALFLSTRKRNTDVRIDAETHGRSELALTILLLTWGILSLSEISRFLYVNF